MKLKIRETYQLLTAMFVYVNNNQILKIKISEREKYNTLYL